MIALQCCVRFYVQQRESALYIHVSPPSFDLQFNALFLSYRYINTEVGLSMLLDKNFTR